MQTTLQEINHAAWLIENSQNLFSKPTQKISSLVLDDQVASKWTLVFQCQIFRYFLAFWVVISVEFFLIFHFGQMFIGFLTSTFDFYRSLALQFSYIIIRLPEGRFLFASVKSLLTTLFLEKTGFEVSWLGENSLFVIFYPTLTHFLSYPPLPRILVICQNRKFLKLLLNFQSIGKIEVIWLKIIDFTTD